MIGNCYIAAWRAYVSNQAVWMACRQSQYSIFHNRMILPLRLIGTILLWLATGVWLLGHYLRFGTWPHWIYCQSIDGDCFEGVPIEADKKKTLYPPPFFNYKNQRYKD